MIMTLLHRGRSGDRAFKLLPDTADVYFGWSVSRRIVEIWLEKTDDEYSKVMEHLSYASNSFSSSGSNRWKSFKVDK